MKLLQFHCFCCNSLLRFFYAKSEYSAKSVFGFLGILDEVGALLYVYKKLQFKITPDINLKVDETLAQWFGVQAVYVIKGSVK